MRTGWSKVCFDLNPNPLDLVGKVRAFPLID
jgi:hypothetical protein